MEAQKLCRTKEFCDTIKARTIDIFLKISKTVTIGYLRNGVILLLRPESFAFFLSAVICNRKENPEGFWS